LPPWRNRWSRTLHYLFFASALTALATGLLRLFFYSKGVDFYVGNPFFWVKMALYVIIATLSIKPTLTFIRWKRSIAGGGTAPTGDEIASVRRFIHIELGLLALLPLMAVLMARGIGAEPDQRNFPAPSFHPAAQPPGTPCVFT
jgi:putative membrane protein